MEGSLSELSKDNNLSCNESSFKNHSITIQEEADISQNDEVRDFKIVLIGSVSVGKTSIFNKFISGDFLENCKSTINIEFKTKYLKIDNNLFAKLTLWDTCGAEIYRAVTRQYFRGAHAIIVIFDLTDQKTFNDLQNIWLKDIKNCGEINIQILIVGNKLDLIDQRKVSESDAINFCKDNGYKYIEASAKEGTNVLKIFEELSFDLAKQYEKEREEEMNSRVLIDFDDKNIVTTKSKNKGCC